MRPLACALLLAVAACGPIDMAPAAPFPAQCEDQVYADPQVKDLLMKSAGNTSFAYQHAEELKFAKIDAARRCMQLKGLAPPGGGVERPRIRN